MKAGSHHSRERIEQIKKMNSGRIVSDETKARLKLASLSSWKTESRKESSKRYWENPDSRKNHGSAISSAHQNPSKYKNVGRIRGYFFSTKRNDNIPYRSSYELEYLKQLESDPLVVSYKYEVVRVSLPTDRITIPDFLVHYSDGHTELVEVKADWCLDRPDVQDKLEAMKKYAEEHNWTFRLVTEKDLELFLLYRKD